MVDAITITRLRSLVLSAVEIKNLTGWPAAMVEDYLNIIDNIITIAELLDVEIHQKLEEVPTDFNDGSIPFASGGFLAEDADMSWDSINNILSVTNAILASLTADRLVSSDANKKLVSVASLTAWIAGESNEIDVIDDGDGTITLSISDLYLINNIFGTTNQIIVTDNLDGTVTLSTPQDIDTDADVEFGSALLDYLDLALDKIVSSQEGRMYWNNEDHTANIDTGIGPVLQIGQETLVYVYNNTGNQIDNGKVVHAVAGFNGYPSVDLAIADTHEGFTNEIWLSTMDIPDGTFGFVTKDGKVRDIDTQTEWNLGDTLYLSPTIAGDMVATPPSFPDYIIQIAGVAEESLTEGQLQVAIKGSKADTTQNFWNGVFREMFDFFVTSDGATITGSLSPTNGHPDMTMMFSDGFTMLDTTPDATIALTPGTDTIPQNNFVYIPKSTKVLTVSTSDWPTTEHIKIAHLFLQTAATTEDEGVLRNQNINDPIENTSTFQGHLSHITEKLRAFEAQWWTGVEGSAVIDAGPTPDSVVIQTTAGQVRQLHLQSFPEQDMTQYVIDAVATGLGGTFTISDDGDLTALFADDSNFSIHNSTNNDGIWTVASTLFSSPDFIITVAPDETVGSVADGTIGDDIHVVNDSTTPYKEVLDLGNEQTDALGNSLNNLSFSFVVWGVQNKTGEPQHLMLNLPTGGYSKNFPEFAVDDSSNHSVYSIPRDFQGVGFLIARFTFVLANNVWTLYDTEDLRGKLPNTTAGGGAGGTGVTTFLGLTDTPSAYTGQAHNTPSVNAGETALEFVSIKDVNGGLVPASMADATANNNTIYYSTDASKLVYKDSVGTVNNLY